MSQAIQRGVILLAICLFAVAGVAVFLALQNKNLKEQNQGLQDKLSDSEAKQKEALAKSQSLQQQASDLSQRLKNNDREKQDLQNSVDDFKKKADELSSQVDQASRERDDWKNRLETIRKERDELMAQLKNRPEKIVYKEKEPEAVVESPEAAEMPAPEAAGGDAYWAAILKEKAVLQVRFDKAKTELDNAALQVADLRKQNSEMQMQIKDLNNEKTEIDRRLTNENKALTDHFDKERQDLQRKLKDGEDLASNLSMEVARARGDQKSANDFVGKVKEDNNQLQSHVRQLVSTKLALEKTVTRLTQEKENMSKKLAETEGVIQDRINEIWQIKQTLDQKISQINQVKSGHGEVELPPIVVNVSSGTPAESAQNQPHKIISMNEKNNFVIVDWGESQGSKIGRVFKVNRGGKDIATLEVIQVRRDISAADIKDKKASLQIGDLVR